MKRICLEGFVSLYMAPTIRCSQEPDADKGSRSPGMWRGWRWQLVGRRAAGGCPGAEQAAHHLEGVRQLCVVQVVGEAHLVGVHLRGEARLLRLRVQGQSQEPCVHQDNPLDVPSVER